jgi:HSP20 family molecular chaperone IbpA
MPNLLRWFVDLAREMDRGMSVMRGGESGASGRREPKVLMGDSGVVVRMKLVGVSPEDVDVVISESGTLTISGLIRPDSDGEKIYNLEDLDLETFREVVNLPVGYESGEARARFARDVLEVFVEKSEAEAETRQLRIEKS